MSASITATPNNASAFISLTANVDATANTVSVVRNNPDGSTSPVRGATNQPTGGATVLAFFDYEAPLDQTVTYGLTVDSNPAVTSAPVKITTDGQTFWLKNVAQESLSVKVQVSSMSPIARRARILATYPVLGRANPVIISDVRSGREGTMVLNTANLMDAEALIALFAQGNALFFQAPASAAFKDMYFMPKDVTETWLGVASATDRFFEVPFVEVDSPTDALVALGSNSWSLVAQFGTWGNVKDKRTTWLDVLNRGFTSADAA